jgi:hypothetical protein
MATTTPNYGWSVPESTDLVKDGATAIELLGDSIDSTTKDLNPSTTEGDIEYRSATADTNARLAIGTAGQVLTVNSGEDAPEWATPATSTSGLTFITKSTASAVSSHTISNCFTSTYTNYRIVFNISAVSLTTNDITLQLSVGGVATTSNYSNQRLFGNNTSAFADTDNRGTDEWDFSFWSSESASSPFGSIEIGNPQIAANSTYNSFVYSRRTSQQYLMFNGGLLADSTQYDGIKILGANGTFSGDFYVYGYQKA